MSDRVGRERVRERDNMLQRKVKKKEREYVLEKESGCKISLCDRVGRE